MEQLNLFSCAPRSDDVVVLSESGDEWTLYVDGASRNNPGPAGAGIYILKNNAPMERHGFFLGNKTNNQAEYFALLLGMLVLKKYVQKNDSVCIISDSELLVKQLNGLYKVKSAILKPLFALAHAMLYAVKGKVNHVLREDNVVADKMANHGIDRRVEVPQEFIDTLRKHEISL